MAKDQYYVLKPGVGTHRRKPTKVGEEGKIVEPGEPFLPTREEMEAFAHKFEAFTGEVKKEKAELTA